MEDYKNNIQLFKKISDELEFLILKFPKEKREEVIFDKWSLKNIVSHLNHWMTHDIDCLTSLLNGQIPFWEPDVEVFNAKGIDQRKNIPWDVIFSEFVGLKGKLIELYESIDENFINKKIWPDKNQTPLRFLDDDINHWRDEHINQLESYYLNSK